MEVRLNYKGNLYGFSRDQSGIGYWYGVRGKGSLPGHVGKFTPNLTVSTVLASELTKEAIRLKLAEPRELSRVIKKEEKPKRNKTVSVRKSNQNPLKGGFNPFQMKAEVEVDPLEIEAEIKLEELKRRVKGTLHEQETTTFFSDLFTPDEDQVEEPETEVDIDITFEEIEPEIIGD